MLLLFKEKQKNENKTRLRNLNDSIVQYLRYYRFEMESIYVQTVVTLCWCVGFTKRKTI